MKDNVINLVILHCGIRTGHFGMGSHIKQLIDFFSNKPDYCITILSLDSKEVEFVEYERNNLIDIIKIPQPENGLFLVEDETPVQIAYAKRISEIAYNELYKKNNIILLCNTVVHYNVAKYLKEMTNAKLVYVHHNFTWKACLKTSYEYFTEQWKIQNVNLHPRAFIGTYYQLQIALLSDQVVTVTNVAEKFFIDTLGVQPDKVKTIYNGIPIDTVNRRNERRLLRKKYGFNENDKIILFCGRIAEEKGLSYLIEAFKIVAKIVSDVKLLIVGTGQIQEALELISPYWSKVTFTGKLEYDAIQEMYAISDIGVMPSTQEQCSITSIEMRFHKLPIIVSSVEGLDEMFEDNYDSLKIHTYYNEDNIIKFSSEELSDRIISLLSDEKFSENMVENSYRKAVNIYSSESMNLSYDNVFKSIM